MSSEQISRLLEILDTAIKIGFGFALSLLAIPLRHRFELRRINFQERNVLLLRISEQFEEANNHIGMWQAHWMCDWTLEQVGTAPRPILSMWEKSSTQHFFSAGDKLRGIEAKLMLLGLHDCVRGFRAYHDQWNTLANMLQNVGSPDAQVVIAADSRLSELRDNFYNKLAEARTRLAP